jgi:hypothetical protein
MTPPENGNAKLVSGCGKAIARGNGMLIGNVVSNCSKAMEQPPNIAKTREYGVNECHGRRPDGKFCPLRMFGIAHTVQ